MADQRKYVSVAPARLQDGVAVGATTANLSAIEDIYGGTLTMSDFGAYGYITVDPTGTKEQCVFTGISGNQISGISTVIAKSPYTQTSGFAFAHAAGVRVIISNTPAFYDSFANKENDETVNGTWTFTVFPEKSGSTTPTAAGQFAPKAYVDGLLGGSANYDQNLIAGTAGEGLTAGNLVYFKESDQKWWKADSDALATTENIRLGFAQATVLSNAAVNVLIAGLEKGQSGLTPGAKYYVSGTAGGITATPGAISRFIGWAVSATQLIFAPEELDDNIVSGTSGEALSAGNAVYFKESDQKWWKTDSDAAATAVGVRIGFVQLAAASADAVTLVRLAGIDQTQTGLTPGTKYYLGSTAGAISATQGTFPRFVGVAISATRLALVDSSNVYAVEQHGQQVYAASSAGTDAYVVSLSPTLPALFNGLTLRIKCDVANTGAATLNPDGLGAQAIVTGVSTPLVTGDIPANQIIEVIYNSNGPVWQLINTPGSLTGGGNADSLHIHDPYTLLYKSKEAGYITMIGNPSDGMTETGSPNRTGLITSFSTDAGNTNNALNANLNTGYSAIDWDNDFELAFFLRQDNASYNQYNFYGINTNDIKADVPNSGTDTAKHVGFYVVDSVLYASVGSGAAQTRTDISSGVTLTNLNLLRISKTASQVLFYVGSTLKATISTNVPTGAGNLYLTWAFERHTSGSNSYQLGNDYVLRIKTS